jgi:NTE family protein
MTQAKLAKNKRAAKPRIALALSGGGPLGAIYEIGALCALDESLRGLSFTGLDHYVGERHDAARALRRLH